MMLGRRRSALHARALVKPVVDDDADVDDARDAHEAKGGGSALEVKSEVGESVLDIGENLNAIGEVLVELPHVPIEAY